MIFDFYCINSSIIGAQSNNLATKVITLALRKQRQRQTEPGKNYGKQEQEKIPLEDPLLLFTF